MGASKGRANRPRVYLLWAPSTTIPRRLTSVALALLLLLSSHLTFSQDKNSFRKDAKASAAKMRLLGEPLDRCSIGAFVANGPIILSVFSTSDLKPGDQLVSLNGENVSGRLADDVVSILRKMLPNAQVKMVVDRGGQKLDRGIPCTNSRPATEAMLDALDKAAAGKFDECYEALDRRQDFGTAGARMKAGCAAFSRNAARYDLPRLGAQALRLMIEDARYAPSLREDTAQRLHNAQPELELRLGPAAVNELVEATKQWPGGEQVYIATEPDWALFREHGEMALRARLVDPDSAQISWPYGFIMGTWKPVFERAISGYWTCGQINARNRMGGYAGHSWFVVVVSQTAQVQYVGMGESKEFDFVNAQCSKSVQLLPSPPAPIVAKAKPAQAGGSLADELKKLANLRSAGALTETEFEAAKKRLLESPSN